MNDNIDVFECIELLENWDEKRKAFMEDNNPVSEDDIPSLMNIASKLINEDTSLYLYGLYKYPETRDKLFLNITEACYMMIGVNATEEQRYELLGYLEQCYQDTVQKKINQTDMSIITKIVNVMGVKGTKRERLITELSLIL